MNNHLITSTDIHKNALVLLQFLASRRRRLSPLLILAHDFPDPDSIASAYALKYLAESFGIETHTAYGGVIGRMENREMVNILDIPIQRLKARDLRKYANVALLDTQPEFQNNSFPKDRRATLVIDQHPYVTKPNAELAIVNTECGATSVILAQALLLKGSKIPVSLGTAIIYGILTDTLNFFRSHKPVVVKTYLSMLRYCDMTKLALIQNPPRARRFFATLGRTIENSVTARSLIVSHLGDVETPDLVAQMADFLLTANNIHWAFCSGRYKGRLYVSLRISTPHAEAGEILRDIFDNPSQAGGHGSIAGGSLELRKMEEPEKTLTDRLRKRLRIPQKIEFRYPFPTRS